MYGTTNLLSGGWLAIELRETLGHCFVIRPGLRGELSIHSISGVLGGLQIPWASGEEGRSMVFLKPLARRRVALWCLSWLGGRLWGSSHGSSLLLDFSLSARPERWCGFAIGVKCRRTLVRLPGLPIPSVIPRHAEGASFAPATNLVGGLVRSCGPLFFKANGV